MGWTRFHREVVTDEFGPFSHLVIYVLTGDRRWKKKADAAYNLMHWASTLERSSSLSSALALLFGCVAMLGKVFSRGETRVEKHEEDVRLTLDLYGSRELLLAICTDGLGPIHSRQSYLRPRRLTLTYELEDASAPAASLAQGAGLRRHLGRQSPRLRPAPACARLPLPKASRGGIGSAVRVALYLEATSWKAPAFF